VVRPRRGPSAIPSKNCGPSLARAQLPGSAGPSCERSRRLGPPTRPGPFWVAASSSQSFTISAPKNPRIPIIQKNHLPCLPSSSMLSSSPSSAGVARMVTHVSSFLDRVSSVRSSPVERKRPDGALDRRRVGANREKRRGGRPVSIKQPKTTPKPQNK